MDKCCAASKENKENTDVLMEQDNIEKLANYSLCLANARRVEIIMLLMEGEKCACELGRRLKITQPSISRHMTVMCDSGLVTGRKQGRWMLYSLNREAYKDLLRLLVEIMK